MFVLMVTLVTVSPLRFFSSHFFAKYTMMTAEAALQSLSCLVSDLEVVFV